MNKVNIIPIFCEQRICLFMKHYSYIITVSEKILVLLNNEKIVVWYLTKCDIIEHWC